MRRTVDFPNMFYNLRRSSPKAYAIKRKEGLISLPPAAEVEEPGNDPPHNDRLDLTSLELTIMSGLSCRKVTPSLTRHQLVGRGGHRPASIGEKVNDSGAELMPPKGGNNKNKQETFFCFPFQRNLCWYEGPHSGKYNRGMVTRLHICAACWLKDKVRASHPEYSKDCPHNQKWLGE